MMFSSLLEGPFNGESPVWDDRRSCLFFVDMTGRAVHSVRLDGGDHKSWDMPELPASIALGESGDLLVALPRKLVVLSPETAALREFAAVPDDRDTNRLNDGKTGPDGAFWVGSMDTRKDREAIGSLYRVTGDGRVVCVASDDAKVSNGLAWTADGRSMFRSDSEEGWIERYGFDPANGKLGAGVRLPSLIGAGRPDGGACDKDGRYWSAGNSAGRLNVYADSGQLDFAIALPLSAPSMPAFCGDRLDQLVVTSLMGARSSERDGSVLIAKTHVIGVPVTRWKDC